MDLSGILQNNSGHEAAGPLIFDLSLPIHRKQIRKLLRNHPEIKIIDEYQEQWRELFEVRHPELKTKPQEREISFEKFFREKKLKMPSWQDGRWVYFSWNNHLIHILREAEFFELRTARNHDLITAKEQSILRKLKIGVAGLSVGNSAALTLILEGFDNLYLSDFDSLALSNLNRIRAGIQVLGRNKAHIAAQQIYEINPYAQLTLFDRGLGEKPLLNFLRKLDIVIDEIDDVIIKIKIRLLARRLRLPVVSAADNGDNSVVDVERFDLEPKRPIYHGSLGTVSEDTLSSLDFEKKLSLIEKMVGMRYVTQRMKESVQKIGKTLYTWPQLGGAALLSGSAVTFVVKKIALKEKLQSGKYNISLDKIFKV